MQGAGSPGFAQLFRRNGGRGAAAPTSSRGFASMSLTPKLLSFAVLMALAGTTAAASTRNSVAIDRALTNINANRAAAHANSGDSFVAKDTIIDSNGDEHVRFTRSFGG